MIPQLQFAANLIAGTLSTYTDIKTGMIDNWITYPLIALGVGITLYTQQWTGILFAIVIFGTGWLAYRSGSMGGGDIKLLAGMALVQPTYEGMIFPLAVLLIGALSACIVFCIYYVGGFLLSKPHIHWNTPRKKVAGALLLVFILLFLYMNAQLSTGGITLLLLEIAMILGLIFYAFEEEVKNHAFLQSILLDNIEDDEVLAVNHLTEHETNALIFLMKEQYDKDILIINQKKKNGSFFERIKYTLIAFLFTKYDPKPPNLISYQDAMKLKSQKITHLPVYRNLPKFAPFLLMGVLATYLFAEWVSQIVPSLL
jgi:Flp pilus assembly protein protease CpaA